MVTDKNTKFGSGANEKRFWLDMTTDFQKQNVFYVRHV